MSRTESLPRCLLVVALFAGGLPGPGAPNPPPPGPPSPRLSAQGEDVPRFEESDCDWPLPEGVEASGVICGYLIVPEWHDNPAGPTLELAVLILLAYGSNSEPDPIVWNTGGPGGSSIDDYGWFLSDSPLRERRDIILVDQRGTGHSRPRLDCPEVDWSSMEDLGTCAARFADQGIDLRAFNTREAAADLADLRKVFDIGKLNLYGVSYGSLLVLETLRSFSPEIRSAVIDGVVPPGIDPFDVPGIPALDLLVERCTEDAGCATAYPDLREAYEGLVQTGDVLGVNPMFVAGMREDFRFVMYGAWNLPAIPLALHSAHEGFPGPLQALLYPMIPPDLAEVTWMTVFCSDIAPASGGVVNDLGFCNPPAEENAAVPADASDPLPWNPEGIRWDEPVHSDVPVLILNGEFDPITPPAYGAKAAATLPNSYSYTFPGYAHGAAVDWGCADAMIATFFDDPGVPPDSACVTQLTGPQFLGPDSAPRVILGPEAGADVLAAGLINSVIASSWVWPAAGKAMMVVHGLWSVLLGALVFVYIHGLSRRGRRPEPETPAGKRPGCLVSLLVLFLFGALYAAVAYILSENAVFTIMIAFAGLVPVFLTLRWGHKGASLLAGMRRGRGREPASKDARSPRLPILTRLMPLWMVLGWLSAGWVLADLALLAVGMRSGLQIRWFLTLRPYSQVVTVFFAVIVLLMVLGVILGARSGRWSRRLKVASILMALCGTFFLLTAIPLAVVGL